MLNTKNFKNISSIDLFEANRFSHYCFDVSSILSCCGYRFSNTEYANAASRTKKTIAILGGSASYSISTPDALTFPRLMSLVLNNTLTGFHPVRVNGSFNVLNFSIPGATLSSLLTTVVDHIIPLDPTIIISFTGFNEIRNILQGGCSPLIGQTSIPETCAEAINRSLYDLHISDIDKESYVLSSDRFELLETVLSHHRVLSRLAKAFGFRYIAAIQPISYLHPSAMSNFETAVYNHYAEKAGQKLLYNKISQCLSILPQMLQSCNIEYVDFNQHPRFLSSRQKNSVCTSLFYDTMHFTHHADAIIASTLAAISATDSGSSLALEEDFYLSLKTSVLPS
jgi:hypothetical protein